MYMNDGRGNFHVDHLDGFNPFKAIGRALGSTGRALVSAIPVVGQAASSVLEVAAHQPAKAAATVAASVAPATPGTTTGTTTDANALALQNMVYQQQALLAQQQAQQGGQYYPPQNYGGQYQQPAQSAPLPVWLIPAGLAAVMLAVVMGRK